MGGENLATSYVVKLAVAVINQEGYKVDGPWQDNFQDMVHIGYNPIPRNTDGSAGCFELFAEDIKVLQRMDSNEVIRLFREDIKRPGRKWPRSNCHNGFRRTGFARAFFWP